MDQRLIHREEYATYLSKYGKSDQYRLFDVILTRSNMWNFLDFLYDLIYTFQVGGHVYTFGSYRLGVHNRVSKEKLISQIIKYIYSLNEKIFGLFD